MGQSAVVIVNAVCIVGGVTLLRAAAKNHSRVTVVCDPADYDKYVCCSLRRGGWLARDSSHNTFMS